MSKQTQKPGPIISEHVLDSFVMFEEVKEINEDQVKEVIKEKKDFNNLFCSNFKANHESKTS